MGQICLVVSLFAEGSNRVEQVGTGKGGRRHRLKRGGGGGRGGGIG